MNQGLLGIDEPDAVIRLAGLHRISTIKGSLNTIGFQDPLREQLEHHISIVNITTQNAYLSLKFMFLREIENKNFDATATF